MAEKCKPINRQEIKDALEAMECPDGVEWLKMLSQMGLTTSPKFFKFVTHILVCVVAARQLLAEVDTWEQAEERRTHDCIVLARKLAVETRAVENLAEFMVDKMGENWSYDGPCPNTHEDLSGEIEWCDWKDWESFSDADHGIMNIGINVIALFLYGLGYEFMCPTEQYDYGFCTGNGKQCWAKLAREQC